MGVPLPSGGTYPPLLQLVDVERISLRKSYHMHLLMDQQEMQVSQSLKE